jgi:hypothetical protein
MESTYIENPQELINIEEIDENTIVYEADQEWKPYRIKENEILKTYIQRNNKLGLKGQQIFKDKMNQEKMIIEEIDQSQAGLKQYINIANDKRIKRGDFIIRNKGNIEIEVKVRTFYSNSENGYYFTIKYSELKSLERMQEILKNKIMFCVFQCINNKINEDKLYFITIDKILNGILNGFFEYDKKEKYLKIPILCCNEGISYLETFA